MKKIGEYTTRGRVDDQTVQRITLFDGRFDTGYRVVQFDVLPSDPTNSAGDCVWMFGTWASSRFCYCEDDEE